jgi:hypothetical protein
VRLLGGGLINNVAFPHDLTSIPGYATALKCDYSDKCKLSSGWMDLL